MAWRRRDKRSMLGHLQETYWLPLLLAKRSARSFPEISISPEIQMKNTEMELDSNDRNIIQILRKVGEYLYFNIEK